MSETYDTFCPNILLSRPAEAIGCLTADNVRVQEKGAILLLNGYPHWVDKLRKRFLFLFVYFFLSIYCIPKGRYIYKAKMKAFSYKKLF